MRISPSTNLDASRGASPLSGRRFGSWVVLFAILLVAVLSIGGGLYYRHQYGEAYEAMRESLTSVAGLKSVDIQNWVKERRGDAEVARSSHAVQNALSESLDSQTRAQTIQIISIFRHVYDYSAVIVGDTTGKVRVTVPDNFPLPESAVTEHIQTALRSPKAVISYLDKRGPEASSPYLWISCPIFKEGKTDGDPVGAVLLVTDPQRFLYPTVQRQPASRPTKSYLVFVQNGRAIGLNGSIGTADESRETQKNFSRPSLAALALRGTDGIFEATNPQGVPVFAAVRNVPGTPWLILVTIDRERILAPVRFDAWIAGIISSLLVLATALGAGLYWRQQKLEFANRELDERKRAAKALEASESRFRLLIENASDIITVANLQGVLRFVSPSAKRSLGHEIDELLNRNTFEFTHPDDASKISEAVEKLIRNPGSSVSVEYRFRHRDGSWRVLQSVARVLPAQSDDSFMVVNSRDVTEKRVLEKQFHQAQKMESIGQLAGGIAHDFNNFLSIIIGYCDLLELEHPQVEKVHNRCEEIKKAGHSAASLTRQLLAFSRQQMMEPHVLDLNSTVVNMGKMLRRLIGADIEFTHELDPALRRIKADPGQIEQVVMNLVVNARDAMPQGGKLAIATANIDFDEDLARLHHPATPGPYVVLSVTDNGCGMDAETQARIFEPFFTTKELGKGTGLGLATVYGIVKQSGGYVWVYSEPGFGTTFKLYFPVTGETVRDAKSLPVSSDSWRGTETILVVEDQDALREMVRSFLVASGYRVLQASRPEEALQIAREHKGSIDLLLTDLVMPGMNGHELAKKLTAEIPDLKVVYMSGYVGFMRREMTGSSEALINKPFTRATLLQKMREVLELQPQA